MVYALHGYTKIVKRTLYRVNMAIRDAKSSILTQIERTKCSQMWQSIFHECRKAASRMQYQSRKADLKNQEQSMKFVSQEKHFSIEFIHEGSIMKLNIRNNYY